MSYSVDYRKRTIEYREEGHTLEETRKVFAVAISTIRTWEKLWREKGTLAKAPLFRSYKKIDPEKLKAYVSEHPDAYPKEIAKAFNCCETAIRKAFARLGITRKKKDFSYKEQDPNKVEAYRQDIAGIASEQISYVDETGIDTYLYRKYGYALKGQKVHCTVSGRKYKRIGIVAAQLGGKIISPLEYPGTMDSSLFEAWFEDHLIPSLPMGTVIVMDNAAFHRKAQLTRIASGHGYRLVFLPPYSPQLNPIEKFWARLKRHLQSTLSCFSSFDAALFDFFQVC